MKNKGIQNKFLKLHSFTPKRKERKIMNISKWIKQFTERIKQTKKNSSFYKII